MCSLTTLHFTHYRTNVFDVFIGNMRPRQAGGGLHYSVTGKSLTIGPFDDRPGIQSCTAKFSEAIDQTC